MLRVNNICEATKDDEDMSKIKEEDVKILSFSNALKELKIFQHLIKCVKNVSEEVFNCLRQLNCY